LLDQVGGYEVAQGEIAGKKRNFFQRGKGTSRETVQEPEQAVFRMETKRGEGRPASSRRAVILPKLSTRNRALGGKSTPGGVRSLRARGRRGGQK